MQTDASDAPITFLWLEITSKCPLQCQHCYAKSGPTGTTGDMHEAHWLSQIDQAAAMGIQMVQFIGGEPITHPSLGTLIVHAVERGLTVEVFSNLLVVPNRLQAVLTLPGVRVATSYYSADPKQHDQITGGSRSHQKTTANIRKLLGWGVRLRVGLIDLGDGQDIAGAYQALEAMGVKRDDIGYDRVREIGRGVREKAASVDQLCGNCADGRAAVLPDGSVQACVMARFQKPIGNVLQQPLADILQGAAFATRRADLRNHFAARQPLVDGDDCTPKAQGPDKCWPNLDLDDILGGATLQGSGELVAAGGPTRPCYPWIQPCRPNIPPPR